MKGLKLAVAILALHIWDHVETRHVASLHGLRANKVLAQTVNIQAPVYQKLQKNLMAQNPTEAALVISERGRTRALVDLLAKRLSTTNDLSLTPSIDKIKQVAKQQNATFVEYSIITDEFNVEGKQETKESELYIWIVKPTGEITFRSVDMKHEKYMKNSYGNKYANQ